MADTAKRMSSPVNRALTSSSIDFGTNFVKKYYIYIYCSYYLLPILMRYICWIYSNYVACLYEYNRNYFVILMYLKS